jgi:Arc/MetJ-type ribon-helix-helix transcriptional regulator
MKRIRITVEITESDKQQIEAAIKNAYPKLKTVSDLVRAALQLYFSKEGQALQEYLKGDV